MSECVRESKCVSVASVCEKMNMSMYEIGEKEQRKNGRRRGGSNQEGRKITKCERILFPQDNAIIQALQFFR